MKAASNGCKQIGVNIVRMENESKETLAYLHSAGNWIQGRWLSKVRLSMGVLEKGIHWHLASDPLALNAYHPDKPQFCTQGPQDPSSGGKFVHAKYLYHISAPLPTGHA